MEWQIILFLLIKHSHDWNKIFWMIVNEIFNSTWKYVFNLFVHIKTNPKTYDYFKFRLIWSSWTVYAKKKRYFEALNSLFQVQTFIFSPFYKVIFIIFCRSILISHGSCNIRRCLHSKNNWAGDKCHQPSLWSAVLQRVVSLVCSVLLAQPSSLCPMAPSSSCPSAR